MRDFSSSICVEFEAGVSLAGRQVKRNTLAALATGADIRHMYTWVTTPELELFLRQRRHAANAV